MADDEQFSLCWNNFNSNLSAGFHESLIRGDLVDVTLAAEGQFVKAHRLVLSVCSPYFRKMFTQMPANQHAFVFLKDVSHTALKDLIQFMYCGEVNVKQEALPAFISTAEALQIKGLTDSEPATQAPAEPATVIPTTQIHNVSAPQRQRQRTTTRTYKLETVDDTDDDQPQQQQQSHHHQTSPSKIQATQIVIQTAAPTSTSSTQQQQQQQHLQQVVQQGNVQHATATTSGTSTQKRSLRGSGGPSLKRTKNTSTTTSTTLVDPLETANETITSQPQITVQAAIVNTMASSKEGTSTTETAEYIDLPLELPSTKSEPDYADEAGDNDNDQDGAYVEDDAYGEMRYDESYFTEGEEGNATGTGNTTTAVVSKSDIKQSGSFTDSFAAGETGDQGNNDTQGEFEDLKELLETEIAFIETPWSTPCLVLNDYMYNCHSKKNSKEYWRCHNYSKKEAKLRCRARCVLENGKLKMITGSPHNHAPHTQKINKIMHRNRVVSRNAALEGMATFARIKYHKRITVPMEVLQMPESNYNPSLPAMEEPQRVTLIEEVSSVDSENANANIKTDLLMDEPVMLLND